MTNRGRRLSYAGRSPEGAVSVGLPPLGRRRQKLDTDSSVGARLATPLAILYAGRSAASARARARRALRATLPRQPGLSPMMASSSLSRRELLRIGVIQVGGRGLPAPRSSHAAAPATPGRRGPARACILLYMD